MSKDFDLIILGSGPGGYVAAIKGAQQGKKTAIVEKADLGGVCLNWGCIPTKALLKSAEIFDNMKHAADYGLAADNVRVDFPAVINRSREVASVNSKGIQFLMKKNKITVLTGSGKLIAKGMIEVESQDGKKKTWQCDDIIIATGARARAIPTIPVDDKNIVTYRKALELRTLPKKMLVIGSGAIGTEFSYFFSALGTEVHLVEMAGQILPIEDEEISAVLLGAFKKRGIKVYLNSGVSDIKVLKDGEIEATLKYADSKSETLVFDRILVAIGMVPNVENLGLQSAGVQLDEKGFIKVDKHQLTTVKGIYAIGDVTGKQMLAHKASGEAETAVAHLCGEEVHGIDYSQIPGCTYCQPQVASVGLTEKKALAAGYEIQVGRFPFQASGKARAIGHTDGLVKLVFDKPTGQLLGAHLVGSEATELLAELGLAMKLEFTWQEIAETIHAHPTLSEAVMEAAWDSQGKSVHI
jgi:dihydrolipoamide dehydrogenase